MIPESAAKEAANFFFSDDLVESSNIKHKTEVTLSETVVLEGQVIPKGAVLEVQEP